MAYLYYTCTRAIVTIIILLLFLAAEVPPINTIGVGDVSFLGERLQFTFLLPVSFI